MRLIYTSSLLLALAAMIAISATNRVAAENIDEFYDLLHRADSLGKAGNAGESDSLFIRAAEIVDDSNALALGDLAKKRAELKYYERRYEDAEREYLKAIKYFESAGEQLKIAETAVNLGVLYYDLGRYEESKIYLMPATEIIGELVGRDSEEYARTLGNLATTYEALGDYAGAESAHKRSIATLREICPEGCETLALKLYNFGVFLETKMRVVEAMNAYVESYGIYNRLFPEGRPAMVYLYERMASLAVMIEAYEEAEQFYEKSLELAEKFFDEDDPEIAERFNNLGVFYITIGDYEKGGDYLRRCLEIYEKNFGEGSRKALQPTANLAFLAARLGDLADARELYERSVAGAEKYFSEFSPDLASFYSDAAMFYLLDDKDYAAARKYYDNLFKIEEKLISDYLPFISESERESFIMSAKDDYQLYFNLVLLDPKPELVGDMFEKIVAFKGLTYYSLKSLRNEIYGTGDSVLIGTYDTWLELKNLRSQLLTLPKEELDPYRDFLDTLKYSINEIEKMLNSSAPKAANFKTGASAGELASALSPGVAIVEIAAIREVGVIEDKFTKETTGLTLRRQYVALIIRSDSEHPEIVRFPDGSYIEDALMKNYKRYLDFYPAVPSDDLYEALWKPIAEKLDGAAKVYLSADGVFNSVNLNNIKIPGTESFLIDSIDFVFLTNSLDVLDSPKREYPKTAALFGFPDYDYVATTAANGEDKSVYAKLVGLQGLSPLPGTLTEIEKIKEILDSAGYETEVWSGAEASEENFKKIERPGIVHAATHGIFFDRERLSDEDYALFDNPLFASALTFAGANSPAPGVVGDRIPEDGFLTAYEALNLDLSDCRLAVLSACETGLGEIRSGEPVYGLQRAFRAAGARYLIMSLRPVEDRSAQELMTTFYEELTATDDVREAFKKAQISIREKYPSPAFWGAFMLIGN